MDTKNDKKFSELGNQAREEIKNDLRSQVISLDQLLDMEIPKNQWIVDRFIPKEGITILAGAPSTYKTWIILQMALAIAQGDMLFDQFKTDQTGVLIVDEENHIGLLKKRMKFLEAERNLPVYFLSKKSFTVENEDQIQKIISMCKELNIGVIVFDSLIRINKADENDASKMSEVFKRIGSFCIAGLTVILTHHEKKNNGFNLSPQSMMRGSSDILASVDALNSISRDKDNMHKLTIRQSKMRMDEEINPFDIAVEKEAEIVRFIYMGEAEVKKSKSKISEEAIQTLLLDHPEGLSKTQIKESVSESGGVGGKTVQDKLKALIEEGVVTMKGGAVGNTQLCFLNLDTELVK